MENISIKEKVARIAEDLPPDATFEDVFERLFFLYKIDTGLKETESGETIPHKNIELEAKKWFE